MCDVHFGKFTARYPRRVFLIYRYCIVSGECDGGVNIGIIEDAVESFFDWRSILSFHPTAQAYWFAVSCASCESGDIRPYALHSDLGGS